MSQATKNIANMARSAFRAAVNAALQALDTKNSGATEPTETYAYQEWADTTSGWLKQRNAANDAWINVRALASATTAAGEALRVAADAAAQRTALAVLSSAQNQTQAATRFTAGGTANAMTDALSPAITSYTAGLRVTTTPGGANTVTGPTLNLNSLGNKTIKKRDRGGTKVALVAGDYNASGPFDFEYDGTDFILLNPIVESAKLTGDIVQSVHSQSGAVATGSTVIPVDNTVPQITEGDQYLSVSITPASAANKLVIEVVVHLAHSAGAGVAIIAALFQDANANAIASGYQSTAAAGYTQSISFRHEMTAGATSATTFRVRCGGGTAGTTTFNGSSGAGLFGGTIASSIRVSEIKA